MMITHGGVTLNSRSMVFYSDPGHGWLKIHKSVLDRLGIADKISIFSYMREDHAYLEEDSDVPLFRDTLVKRGFEQETVCKFITSIEERSSGKSSKIRGYETYSNT